MQKLAAAPLRATPTYWFCMFAGSALGTNMGDFTVDWLGLGRETGFAALAILSALAIWGDSRLRQRSELSYWVAIVLLRAAATIIGDYMTHDLGISYVAASVGLGIATLIAGWFTIIDPAQGRTPLVDRRYWIAMLIAGVFGTIGGDLTSHTIGLFAAAGVLCAVLLVVLGARTALLPASVLGYWVVILAERAAGTPVGDSLASRHGFALGLPLAMCCTFGLLAVGLLVRNFAERSLPASGEAMQTS